jgi:hypothetical protein
VLHGYLPNKVAHTNCNLPGQHPLTVFGYPKKVHFQIVFRVRAQLITFHAPTLHDPKARLQGADYGTHLTLWVNDAI